MTTFAKKMGEILVSVICCRHCVSQVPIFMGRTIFKVLMVGICGTSVLSVQESPPERMTL